MKEKIGCFELYKELLPSSFFEKIGESNEKGGIFTTALVVWLMMWQRLHEGASMSDAVLRVSTGFWSELSGSSARVLEKKVAESTGGYSQARSKVQLATVEAAFDEMYSRITSKSSKRPVYLIDGTTIVLSTDASVRKEYPPARNNSGEAKNGILHVLVAHDLELGYALRPAYGAAFGDKVSSEARLLRELAPRLPKESIVIGDSNFGIFVSCYELMQQESQVIVRLTDSRAKKVAGEPPYDGMDKEVVWTPSSAERKKYKDLPESACIKGRVICRKVQPHRGPSILLKVFSTLTDTSAEEIVETYSKRWKVEVDLRTLKKTVNMEKLPAKSPEMVAKELLMGVAAYNLIRAIMAHCAQLPENTNRKFSFTKILNIVRLFMPKLADATTAQERSKILDDVLYYAGRAKLPNRKSKQRTKDNTG